MDEKPKAYLLRSVPPDIYHEVQRIAKKRGLTLRAQIILLMEEFVNETKHESPEKPRE